MIKTEFMDLYEELGKLNESEDLFLRTAIQMFQADEDAKGVVVSIKPEGQAEEKVCKLYHTDEELDAIVTKLLNKYGSKSYINAYHDRGVIGFFNDKWKKQDAKAQKEAQIELNNIFNKKLMDTMRDAGVPYVKVLEYISEEDWLALYQEYLPTEAPSDSEDQDKLIRIFIKELKQIVNKKSEPDGASKTELEVPKLEPKNAKLTRARQNNSKIVKAFKEVGLPTDDLVAIAKNKNGRDYKKASEKLNKLRKTLFGEAFEEELDNPFDQEF